MLGSISRFLNTAGKGVTSNSKATKAGIRKVNKKPVGDEPKEIKAKNVKRDNFIPIGGEAIRNKVVSTKPEKSGHPLYTKKVTEQEKKEFQSAYNRIKNDNKKPVNPNLKNYKTQAEIPVGATKRHADGSTSVKNADGSITKTSKAGEKMSHTDSKGNTRYYNSKGEEVKSGYTNIADVRKRKEIRTKNKGAFKNITKISDEELNNARKKIRKG